MDMPQEATDRLRAELDRAAAAMGTDGVVDALVEAGYRTILTGHMEKLDDIARLVHASHDPFAPRHCAREVCREIEDLRSYLGDGL